MSRISKRFQEERAFTLLEVSVALLLLGVVSMILLPAFFQLLSSREYLTDRMYATFLGYLKLEEVVYGAERAQEGDCPEPWSGFKWRYHEEKLDKEVVRHVVTVKWRIVTGERKITVSRARARANNP